MFDCKNNFRHQFENKLRICKETSSLEDEDHLLNCKQLSDDEHNLQIRKMKIYLDIFVDGPDAVILFYIVPVYGFKYI